MLSGGGLVVDERGSWRAIFIHVTERIDASRLSSPSRLFFPGRWVQAMHRISGFFESDGRGPSRGARPSVFGPSFDSIEKKFFFVSLLIRPCSTLRYPVAGITVWMDDLSVSRALLRGYPVCLVLRVGRWLERVLRLWSRSEMRL